MRSWKTFWWSSPTPGPSPNSLNLERGKRRLLNMVYLFGCYLLWRIFNNQAQAICVRYGFEFDRQVKRGRGGAIWDLRL